MAGGWDEIKADLWKALFLIGLLIVVFIILTMIRACKAVF